MLRPRGYRVKLVTFSLASVLEQVLAIETAREDASQGVGELFERIGHRVNFGDSWQTRKLG